MFSPVEIDLTGRAKPGDEREVKSVNDALNVLIRGKVLPESAKIANPK